MKTGITLSSSNDLIIETFPIGSYACNCTVIFSQQSKEAIVIDPGNDAPTLLRYLENKELKVTHLLHTHAHFDHIGQSGLVKEKTKAKLCLHKDDLFLYQALKQQALFFQQTVGEIVPLDSYIEHHQEYSLPQLSSSKFQAVHTPGHTPGSCSFYGEFGGKPLLIAGDTLFYRSVGRTDLPGGDWNTIEKSIKERLYTLPDETIVVTGHGPLTQLAQEKRQNPFVHQ